MSEVHDNIQSVIGAYAMGAVPEDEIPSIRAHILTCDECFEEAESYAEALAVLAESVEPAAISDGFADRVLAEAVGDRDSVVEKPRRFAFAWPGALRTGLAVAMVALVGVSASYIRSIDKQREYQRIVTALVNDPGALALQGAGGASGLIASTQEGSIFVALDLGEAPEGRDYQLWLMQDGVPVPDVTFDVSDEIVVVESDRSLSEYDGAAVTVEPEGGSEQPTTDPVLVTES